MLKRHCSALNYGLKSTETKYCTKGTGLPTNVEQNTFKRLSTVILLKAKKVTSWKILMYFLNT